MTNTMIQEAQEKHTTCSRYEWRQTILQDEMLFDDHTGVCREYFKMGGRGRRCRKKNICLVVCNSIGLALILTAVFIPIKIKDENSTATGNPLSTRNDTNTSRNAKLDFSQSTGSQTTDGASDVTPSFRDPRAGLLILGIAIMFSTCVWWIHSKSLEKTNWRSINGEIIDDMELETMTSSRPTENQSTLFLKENVYVISKKSNDTVENVAEDNTFIMKSATNFDNISSQQAPNKRLNEKEDTPIQAKTHRQASDANYQLNSTAAEEPNYTTLREDEIIPGTVDVPNASTESKTNLMIWSDVNNKPILAAANRCKETFSHLKYRVQVSVVKPLKSGDENNTQTEQNKAHQNDNNSRLDWNKVFKFLAENLPPTNYKLFFVSLYDHLPQGMDIDTRISKTECDFKSGGTTTLIFELFKSWKQILGTRAKPSLIENALSEMNYNDVRNRFQDYMREPPLLPKIVESTKPPYEYPLTLPYQRPQFNRPIPQESQVLALYDTVQTQSCLACRTKFQIQTYEENRIAYVCHNQNNQLMLGNSPSTSGQIAYNISSSFKIDDKVKGEKRRWTDTDSSESDRDGTERKYSRTKHSSVLFQPSRRKEKKKRGKHPKQSATLVPWEKVDKAFIINLMKSYLPLGSQMLTEDQYNVFMYHTVSIITAKTGECESVVTSLKKEDFDEAKELKTKRGHVSYTIDSETALLMLGQDEWDCLKLYAVHARESVLKRLKTDERKLACTEYLFISFSGQSIIEQNDEVHEMSHVTEEVSDSIADTTPDNSTSTDEMTVK
ncbi:uncharacterized protein LOC123541960 [Mercenaria mercenaria]|uniref:uncharacterized protein LOC123541960 n=1 Tax=Mercenaria mercenaria TaxID=6596 RepID=UPI00234E7F88|nr:uncharacterized protein LOC123541960 [Mercenaria mercenaria]